MLLEEIRIHKNFVQVKRGNMSQECYHLTC